jgi:SOS response regulatory protein OraA/RecX
MKFRTSLHVTDRAWAACGEHGREAVRVWLRDHGMDPNIVRSVRVEGEGLCVAEVIDRLDKQLLTHDEPFAASVPPPFMEWGA